MSENRLFSKSTDIVFKGVNAISARKHVYFSYHIAAFCKLVEQAEKDYKWNLDELKRLDGLTQDYLHKLEIGDLDYKGRAKLATKLAECRQHRRNCKNVVEMLEPLIAFTESKSGKGLMNSLKNVLGEVRKKERYLNHATYVPRVLSYDEYEGS